MKYIYGSLIAYGLFLNTAVLAQTPSTNYVINRAYKHAGITEDLSSGTFSANSNQAGSQITYFDGLGKPTQQVMAFASASKGDIITLTEYDELHRPIRTYLPSPFTSNGGLLQQASDIKTTAGTYYKDGTKVSTAIDGGASLETLSNRIIYERSPLNRPNSQQAPGASGKVTQLYGVNSAADAVKLYRSNGPGLVNIEQQGVYNEGELTSVQTEDENQQVKIDFTDRYGRIVLKRVKILNDQLDTYYVYDEKGQLRAVLQPNYQKDGFNLDKSAFLYRYDELKRIVEKKIPGANAVKMTYKSTTELLDTFTDGLGNVFYYNYDSQNRQIEMGINGTPLLYTYYDTYDFGPFQNFNSEIGNSYVNGNNAKTPRVGFKTGSKARVLKPDGQFGDWLQTVIYYDDKYRIIQTIRQLYGFSNAAYERVSYRLAFNGKPELEWTTQETGSLSYRLIKDYTYDHADRLLSTTHTLLENGVQKTTYNHVEQLYNEIGQLATKSLHGGIQIMNYRYTPRGWIGDNQTKSGQPFSLGLSYQDNGSIASQSWTTKTYSGGMNLSYDKANRLIEATGTGNFANYDEASILYDANGNISKLTRKYNNTVIDQLAYQYRGNQLHRVDDSNNNEGQFVKGFIDNANADDEMRYDGNGNLIADDNRSITGISYNVLNLPRSLTRNSRTVLYTYDAAGIKLKTEAPDNANTFYAGAFEYRADNTLLRVGLEEGQLVKDGSNYVVNYYLRDHLGNVRSVIDESGTIIQETEYYAFGLPIQRSGSDKNKYLFNGNEKQPETEWLDYGARMYDPSIGRWMTIDPLSEIYFDHSGYTYVSDNPVNLVDPTGMAEDDSEDEPIYRAKNSDLAAVTVTAKRLTAEQRAPQNYSYEDNMQLAYYRNKAIYGNASPFGDYFRAGGRDAAIVLSAPVIGIAAAEGGLATVISGFNSKLFYSKLALSLTSQYVGAVANGEEFNVDVIDLLADQFLQPLAGAAASAGLDLTTKEGLTTNSLTETLVGTATGFASNRVEGRLDDIIMNSNLSTTFTNVGNYAIQLYQKAVTSVLTPRVTKEFESKRNR